MRKLLWSAAACGLLGAVAWAADAGAPAAPVPEPENVKITIITPGVRAVVFYGKKNLGVTPIEIERKRDSGPMDLVVRASGFLPVATRAYTFRDDKVVVKMTPEDEAHTVYGWRAPLPDAGPDAAPADEDAPDGGVSPPPAPSPASRPPPPAP